MNAAVGTFVLTVQHADGIKPSGGTITVVTNSSTVFAKGRHQVGTIADVAVNASVNVGGSFDATTQTLTAKFVILY